MAQKKKNSTAKSAYNGASAGFYGGAGASVLKAGKGNPKKGVKAKVSSYADKLVDATDEVPAAAQKGLNKKAAKANARTAKSLKVSSKLTNRAGAKTGLASVTGKKSDIRSAKRATKVAGASTKVSRKLQNKSSAKAARAAAGPTEGDMFNTGFKKGFGVVAKSNTYKSGYKGAAVGAVGAAAYTTYKRRTASGKVITVRRKGSAKKK